MLMWTFYLALVCETRAQNLYITITITIGGAVLSP
jgi:hypothetical protein